MNKNMKRAIVGICLAAFVLQASEALANNKVKYTYDASGNRIKRENIIDGCATTFSNQTVNSNKTVTGCNDLDVKNVTVTNNAKLILNVAGEIKISKSFEIQPGSQLEIKK